MTKPNRPIASAALVLACVLLPAGFLSHGHDDRALDGHDHDCIVCCLRDHSTLAISAEPSPAAPAALAPAAASAPRRGALPTALDPRLPRGPPA